MYGKGRGKVSKQPNIIKEVLEWSKQLPLWQSDALRRLLIQGELSPLDKEEIANMAKISHQISVDHTPPNPTPLSEEHVSRPATPGDVIVLNSMQEIKNVNALLPEQVVTFSSNGITVVYGENGTGKSGYSRVLKRACRARHTEPILPNIFKAQDGDAPIPEATFNVSSPIESIKKVKWVEGETAPEELSQIAEELSRMVEHVVLAVNGKAEDRFSTGKIKRR